MKIQVLNLVSIGFGSSLHAAMCPPLIATWLLSPMYTYNEDGLYKPFLAVCDNGCAKDASDMFSSASASYPLCGPSVACDGRSESDHCSDGWLFAPVCCFKKKGLQCTVWFPIVRYNQQYILYHFVFVFFVRMFFQKIINIFVPKSKSQLKSANWMQLDPTLHLHLFITSGHIYSDLLKPPVGWENPQKVVTK